jgi:WD40 repeat protein
VVKPPGRPAQVEAIFDAAMARPKEEREAFVAQACGGDEALRAEVMLLLASVAGAWSLMAAAPPSAEALAQMARLKPEEAGDQIGRYKLREQIGEGGFGTVWVADQVEPVRRRVALKIIKMGMDTKDVIARFEQERQALAMMDHPHIAKVLDAGATAWGRPFFVMELVRGIRITDYCDQEQLTTDERLKLFVAVCNAVQHAHQKGIIHRDIKPSNILVTLHDGVPVPKVIDFGVAKATQGRLTDLTIYTQFQQMIGTPLYMSPEQAEMSGLDVDTRSDIYSLGVLLYELLIGRTPIDSDTLRRLGLDEIRRLIREQESPRPSTALHTMEMDARTVVAQRRKVEPPGLLGLLRGDLDAIVMKALEKDRTHRYETANGLAMDVQRYLDGEPVLARPTSQFYRLGRMARRNKGAFAAALAVLAALFIGAAVAGWQAVRAWQAEGRARAQAAEAVAARTTAEVDRQRAQDGEDRARAAEMEARRQSDLSEERLYFSHMLLVGRDLAEGRPESARRLLEAHRRETSGRDLRDWEWYFLYGQLSQETVRVMAHRDGAPALAVSPDGLRVATVGSDGEIALWDTRGLRELARWRAHDAAALCVAWDKAGKRLATGSANGEVRIWDAESRQTLDRFAAPTETAVQAVAWEPAEGPNARLAIGAVKSCVQLWRPGSATGTAEVEDFSSVRGSIHGLSWSRDGQRLAAAFTERNPAAVIFEVGSKKEVFGTSTDIFTVAFDPAGTTLATGSKHQIVAFYVSGTNDPQFSRTIHQSGVSSVAWHPTGKFLASGSYDGTIRLINRFKAEAEPQVFPGHGGKVLCIAWATVPAPMPGASPAAALFSTGSDGTLRAWGTERVGGQTFAVATKPNLMQVRWSPQATQFAVVTWNEEFLSVDPLKGVTPLRLAGAKTGYLAELAWSPDGRRWALSSRSKGEIAIVNVDGTKIVAEFSQPGAWRLAWHPDGRHLASGSAKDTRVWDTIERRLVATIPRAAARITWHRDGKRLAIGTNAGAVEIWDGIGGKHITTWREAPPAEPGVKDDPFQPPHRISDLAWSPDGEHLAFVTQDTVAMILDATTGAPLQNLIGHTGGIWCVTWSGDGRRLATSGQDGRIRVFNPATGDQVAVIRHGVGDNNVSALDWSHDGRCLLSGGYDNSVRGWDVSRGRDLSAVRERETPLASQQEGAIQREPLAGILVRLGWADQARAEFARAIAAAPADRAIAAQAQQGEAQLVAALHSSNLPKAEPPPDPRLDPRLVAAFRAMGLPAAKPSVKTDADGRISLYLDDLAASDFSPLRGLPIRALSAQAAKVSDLSPLVGMPIETLDLSGCTNIRDFGPLGKIPDLTALYFHRVPIAELRGLAGLGLRTLHLEDTRVSDLAPLKGMRLEELALARTEVVDVSPLVECPKLKRLWLPQTATNVETLRQHPGLTHLSFSWDTKNRIPAQTRDEFWTAFDLVRNVADLCAQGALASAADEFRKLAQANASPHQREQASLAFARGQWKVTWFPSRIGPRSDLEGWRKLAKEPSAITEGVPVIDFLYRMTGPRRLNLTPALTERGPEATDFGTIARAQLKLPRRTWKFTVRTDDGIRVIVNGQPLIEQWIHQGPTNLSAVHRQTTDEPVDIVIEHFQEDGWAELKFGIEPVDE